MKTVVIFEFDELELNKITNRIIRTIHELLPINSNYSNLTLNRALIKINEKNIRTTSFNRIIKIHVFFKCSFPIEHIENMIINLLGL